jgi:hypothetical protein
MPTGRPCGDGAWNALSTSATKTAVNSALTMIKPACGRNLARFPGTFPARLGMTERLQ